MAQPKETQGNSHTENTNSVLYSIRRLQWTSRRKQTEQQSYKILLPTTTRR